VDGFHELTFGFLQGATLPDQFMDHDLLKKDSAPFFYTSNSFWVFSFFFFLSSSSSLLLLLLVI
jgi:hypothetical protein